MQQTYDSLLDCYLANIRLLKAYRGVSDTDLVALGAFGTRQGVSLRTRGIQPPTLLDLVKFGAAFRVEPTMMLAPAAELLAWVQEHPDYTLPVEHTASHIAPKDRTAQKKGRAQTAERDPHALTKTSGRARTSPGRSPSPRRAAS
jgi:hypothetical protein